MAKLCPKPPLFLNYDEAVIALRRLQADVLDEHVKESLLRQISQGYHFYLHIVDGKLQMLHCSNDPRSEGGLHLSISNPS